MPSLIFWRLAAVALWMGIFSLLSTFAFGQTGYRNSSGSVLLFTNAPTTNDIVLIGTKHGAQNTNKNVYLKDIFGGTNQTFYAGNGFNISTKHGSPARIYFADDHSNGHGYVALGGVSGDVVLSPTTSGGLLQLGTTANAGNEIYLQYANDPASSGWGFSHPLTWKAVSTGGVKHYPGIVGFSQQDSSDLGELWVYARTPFWNVGNNNPAAPNTAGNAVASFGTNGIIAKGSVWFRGPLASPADIWATNDLNAVGDVRVGARVEVGSGANGTAGSWAVDISSGANSGLLLGADLSAQTRTDATAKYAYVTMWPYNNAQPKITLFQVQGLVTGGEVRYGGGTGVNQPVVLHRFYAGPAGTAAAGNEQFQIADGTTDVKSAKFLISAPTVPATASSTGTAGQIAWDSGYIYVCTAANTWKRVAIATW